ncbi:MAG TPA: F0F1 ATP synthase subunit epsilon [Xanthobacteraceae bacterium]|nr:F0F1 ATP synthase subunit epsilon [Xanthobacteraceae bacterium]
MATFHFDLVAPDKLVFTGEVEQVDVPAIEGDFGVLAGHAPVVALLKPGILVVHQGGQQLRFVVFGGFAEVNAQGLTILAEYASTAENTEIAAMMNLEVAKLEEQIAKAEPGSVLDGFIMRLDHFKTLDQHLIGTAMH